MDRQKDNALSCVGANSIRRQWVIHSLTTALPNVPSDSSDSETNGQRLNRKKTRTRDMRKIERNISFKEYQNYREQAGVYPALKGLVINSSSLSDIDEEKEKDSGSAARFKYNYVEDNKERTQKLRH